MVSEKWQFIISFIKLSTFIFLFFNSLNADELIRNTSLSTSASTIILKVIFFNIQDAVKRHVSFSLSLYKVTSLPSGESIYTLNSPFFIKRTPVTVEAELGVLAGIEDDVKAESHTYTNPDEVEEFVNKTGVDSLAIAIGTSHGAHKFKPGEDPKLRLDILEEIERRIPGFPIVLHGSSAVPKQYTDMIKEFGGEVKDAIGIPNAELRKASKSAVAKINVDTDGRLAFTAAIRRVLGTTPKEFDPRKYLGAAKDEMKAYYKTKIVDVFGSEGAYKKGTK